MALSIMVKFTKPGRLIAQTSYLGRFKPLKMFGKSFKKNVHYPNIYSRISESTEAIMVEVTSSTKLADAKTVADTLLRSVFTIYFYVVKILPARVPLAI